MKFTAVCYDYEQGGDNMLAFIKMEKPDIEKALPLVKAYIFDQTLSGMEESKEQKQQMIEEMTIAISCLFYGHCQEVL